MRRVKLRALSLGVAVLATVSVGAGCWSCIGNITKYHSLSDNHWDYSRQLLGELGKSHDHHYGDVFRLS